MILIGSLAGLLLLFYIITRNGLIAKKNDVENSFSTIDVMLKKRYDLIPNLVSTVKEYNLIYLLRTNREIVLTREEILEKVLKSTYYSGDRTVDIYISKLREKLKSISKDIRTVEGVCYKLEEKR